MSVDYSQIDPTSFINAVYIAEHEYDCTILSDDTYPLFPYAMGV